MVSPYFFWVWRTETHNSCLKQSSVGKAASVTHATPLQAQGKPSCFLLSYLLSLHLGEYRNLWVPSVAHSNREQHGKAHLIAKVWCGCDLAWGALFPESCRLFYPAYYGLLQSNKRWMDYCYTEQHEGIILVWKGSQIEKECIPPLHKIKKNRLNYSDVRNQDSLFEEGWRSFWKACVIYYLYLGHG